MPIYDYKCSYHGLFEKYLPISKYDELVICPDCGAPATKVLSAAVHGDEAAWIRDVNLSLNDGFMPKIENRTDLKRIMKERGISQVG